MSLSSIAVAKREKGTNQNAAEPRCTQSTTSQRHVNTLPSRRAEDLIQFQRPSAARPQANIQTN